MDEESNLLLNVTSPSGQQRSKLATASFVSGILTLAGLLLGSVVPGLVYLFLFFIVALVTGHLARRAFRKEEGRYTNESWATFGLAMGYLGVALSVVSIAALVAG